MLQLVVSRRPLSIEFSVRGCNIWYRAGPLLYPPAGFRGKAVVGVWGEAPRSYKIGTMKYCAYKNWFLCIICLYVIAKTCTGIETTYSYATRQAAMATLDMTYPARAVWIGVR